MQLSVEAKKRVKSIKRERSKRKGKEETKKSNNMMARKIVKRIKMFKKNHVKIEIFR